MRMKTLMPARKVNVAAIGGALATILLWGLRTAWPDLVIPEPVAAAIAALVVFVAGYITPPSPADGIVTEDNPAPAS